jgi:hypothetical protein
VGRRLQVLRPCAASGKRAWGRGPAVRRGAGAPGTLAGATLSLIHLALFDNESLQKFRIEVYQVMNRKVVDLTTLYNFYNGSIVFFTTNFA